MKVIESVAGLKKERELVRKMNRNIGFVPTMGALHQGHLSLVDSAAQALDYVVVSIFVNPTQFNNPDDLLRYPRTLDADLKMLETTGCDLVFIPSEKEIYPEKDTRIFHFGTLGTVMEGKYRPGHFNGVAQVVSRLFDIVDPQKAYFGLKDFQQLAIIKSTVKQLKLNVEIVPCPIVREPDGLAMSSRNRLLTDEQRENAPLIAQTLFEAVRRSKYESVQNIRDWVAQTIDQNPFLKTEYFEIVHEETLLPIENWEGNFNKVGCIAVHCNAIRLIDNVIF